MQNTHFFLNYIVYFRFVHIYKAHCLCLLDLLFSSDGKECYNQACIPDVPFKQTYFQHFTVKS